MIVSVFTSATVRFVWPLAGLLAIFGCSSRPEPIDLPDGLIGVWTTTDERYQGRSFELTEDNKMLVGTGGDAHDVYIITRIEVTPDEHRTGYNLYYLNDAAQEYIFRFYYEPRDGGVISFANQTNLIWSRKKR